jgi:hypothetical protein
MPTPYQFDPTGTLLANRITGEQHIITAVANRNYHFTVPTYAPFFADGLSISYRDIDNNIRFLVEGIDYLLGFQFIAASRSCAKPIYGGISYLNLELAGVVTLVYQTVGGDWTIDPVQINEILSDTLRNPRVTSWETVANVPTLFPVVDHEWNLQDLVGMSDVKDSIDAVTTAIANAPAPAPLEYPGLVATKHTVGLGNVQNFSIATDAEAQAGTSITKYMTPRAVRVAIQFLGDLLDNVQASLLALAAKTGATLVGTATNQTLDQAILRVKTIAELRTLDIPSTDADTVHSVVVLGRDAVGDTATGTYYWSTTSSEVDNGYTVVKPDSDPALGRWIHEDKDAYAIYGFTTTLNQNSFVLGKTPLPGTHVKIVVNKFVELISTINYFVNDKTITFTEAFPADQRVDIVIQTKPVKSNDPGNNIYQKFTATGPGDVYLLTRRPIDPDAYYVRLNDVLVLFHGVDFTVVDNQFTVSYPVLAGDVVEFMYHYHPTGLSPFVLREVVGW